jgi:hypothetical protein
MPLNTVPSTCRPHHPTPLFIHIITIPSILFGDKVKPGIVLTQGRPSTSQEWTRSIFSLYHKPIVIIFVVQFHHQLWACRRNKGRTPRNWTTIETHSQCRRGRFFMKRLRQDKMLKATTQTPNCDLVSIWQISPLEDLMANYLMRPIQWWMGRRAQFPNLFRLDILCIPGELF